MAEILMGRIKFDECSAEQKANLLVLYDRINQVRKAYGKPLKVNDGLRLPNNKPKNGAEKSNHYKGAAIDLDDDDAGTFWKWVFENRQLLADIGLWCEHPCWTHCDGMSWMHFQIVPPNSGNRFYVPSIRPNPNPSFWDGVYEPELNSKNQPN